MNQEIEIKNATSATAHDVLLVHDKTKNNVQAVQRLEPDGGIKTVSATKRNQPQFIRIDRQGDFLSNFFTNFITQLKDPTNFSFLKVPEEHALDISKKMQVALKTSEPNLDKILAKYEIKTLAEAPDVVSQRFKEEQIDWEGMNKLGLGKEYLEKRNLLEPLLKGFKTNELLPININLGTATLRTDARLSLQTNAEGKVSTVLHGIRKEPNLNQAFFGHSFSEEDKKNLLETGNMGRVVNLTNSKTGESIPSIISIDKLTNDIIALRTDFIKIPDAIKGVKLNEEQKQTLKEGKPLQLTGMLSTKGTEFSATLQFNADKRYTEFLFDRNAHIKQNVQQSNTQDQLLEAPKTFRGKELTDEQYKDFKEGKTIYMAGLVDKKGQNYNGYITFNQNAGKTHFEFPNQYKERAQPTQAHATQTAVNSEGKTNEATKNIKEPLKTGQNSPKNKQQQESQNQPKTVTKTKGRKM